jgi:hypothetical protein
VFLFFAVIAAALAGAVLLGGDVRRLSQLRVRNLELLLAAFGAKIVVAVIGFTHSAGLLTLARPLNIVGALLLLLVVWFNRRLPGALLFGAGLALNLVALFAFGGRMPVLIPDGLGGGSPALALLRGGLDPLHVVLTSPHGLWFIGDIMMIPSLNGHYSVVSVGDLLMAAGIAWLILRCSLRRPVARPVYRPTPSR